MIDYLPVMLSIDHPHPELETWVAARFEALNGHPVHIIRRQNIAETLKALDPAFLKAWLWDFVPSDTQRIVYFDFDVIPLRPLPLLPDTSFAVSTDWLDERARRMYPSLSASHYFNAGLFVARRETRACFNRLKSFALRRDCTSPFVRDGTKEQTPFNQLIQADFDVCWLPRAFNCLAHTGYSDLPTASMLHLAAVRAGQQWLIMEAVRLALANELPTK